MSITSPWRYIGLALAVVATAAIVFVALTRIGSPASTTWEPPASALVADESTNAAPVALFFGDSYSHGVGASSEAARWTTLVSTSLGFDEVNQAYGGTGYLTSAGLSGCGKDYCPTYLEAIEAAPATVVPQVVFVAGGQNDFRRWADEADDEIVAIDATFAAVRAKYPDARIVAVGPSVIGDVTDAVTGINEAVKAAAAAVGAQYVDLAEPDVLDPSMDVGDGGHVNDAGHRAIADRVLSVIAA